MIFQKLSGKRSYVAELRTPRFESDFIVWKGLIDKVKDKINKDFEV